MKKYFSNREVKNKEEARHYAIDWQNWSAGQNLSYMEMADWYAVFLKIAKKYRLVREFRENSII